MERKLRFLEKEIKKDEIPMLDTGDSPEAPQPREMIDLEVRFDVKVFLIRKLKSYIVLLPRTQCNKL